MAYKKHIIGLIIRLILIFINLLFLAQIIFNPERLFSIIILLSILVLQLVEFIRRELKLFNSFEEFIKTVEFEDRSVKFISKLPKGLQSLADMFNKLLEVIEKKRSENEAQYIFLEELLKNVRVGVLTVSSQEKVELANPISLQILGLSSIHKLSQIKDSSEQLYEIIRSCKGELSTIIESDNYSLSLQINNLSIQGKEIKLISFQDIKHQIELKEMQAWHQLIRTLGHEILNSVTPISSMTETGLMLLQNDQNQAKQIQDLSQAQLEKIRNALLTVNRRSNSLLDFIENYRKLTRMPKPNIEEVNLCELVDDLIDFLTKDFSESEITINKLYMSTSIKAFIDKSMIEQVIINLIKNAIHSMKVTPLKQLTIKIGVDEDLKSYLMIKDTGCGISKEVQEKIFIPFYTTKDEGTGIGLSLSRQIIQLHGGKILVQTKEGEGSEFRLMFKKGY